MPDVRPDIVAMMLVAGLLCLQVDVAFGQNQQLVRLVAEFNLTVDDEIPDVMRNRGVIQTGTITLPGDLFNEPPSDFPPEPIFIPIGGGRSVGLIERSRKTNSDGSILVIGVEQSDNVSRFAMLLENNALRRGEIRFRNEVISLTAPKAVNGDLKFRMVIIDSNATPRERSPLDPALPQSESGESVDTGLPDQEAEVIDAEEQAEPPSQFAATIVEIDLMVVYTAAAKAEAFAIWQESIEDSINFLTLMANIGYEDQGGVRLNLVHTEQVSYTESGDIGEDVKRLACPCDHKLKDVGNNNLNEVFVPWKQYKADIVTLLVDAPDPNDSGIAYIMQSVSTDFASNAVNVVDVAAAAANWSFDHEIGHNFGARHDRANANKFGSPYLFNHGFANSSVQMVTIMAYRLACLSFGYQCTRAPIWSDPTALPVNTWGIAAGPFAADNARTLQVSAQTVAAFDSKHNRVGCCVRSGGIFYSKWKPGICP